MTDVIRKTYFYMDSQIKEYRISKPLGEKLWYRTADEVFNAAHALTDSIAKQHPLYHGAARMQGHRAGQRSHHPPHLRCGRRCADPRRDPPPRQKRAAATSSSSSPSAACPTMWWAAAWPSASRRCIPTPRSCPWTTIPTSALPTWKTGLQMLIMTEKAPQPVRRPERQAPAAPPRRPPLWPPGSSRKNLPPASAGADGPPPWCRHNLNP